MMMTNTIQKVYAKVLVTLNNQKGAQAIEWIALAGVVLAVFVAVQGFFAKGEDSVGRAIAGALSRVVGGIGNGEGGGE
jgi:formate hydrogenlyase subunit 3/multisubunit Na+/H+ antiporter MnhD subunit